MTKMGRLAMRIFKIQLAWRLIPWSFYISAKIIPKLLNKQVASMINVGKAL